MVGEESNGIWLKTYGKQSMFTKGSRTNRRPVNLVIRVVLISGLSNLLLQTLSKVLNHEKNTTCKIFLKNIV